MKFSQYPIYPEVVEALSLLEYKKPTDIQYKCIPHILNGEDVFAVAQTGTGKTAAFAIPIINNLHHYRLTNRRTDGVKCIILVPTHELARQIEDVCKTIGKKTRVKCLAIYGGVSQDPQIKALNTRIDLVIATPGRMFDLIAQGHLDIHRVQTLVIDEADQMLALGFLQDVEDLCRKLPPKRQTLFFSATINKPIKKLAYQIIRQSAIRIQISPKDPVAKNVTHGIAYVEMDDKRFFLEKLANDTNYSKILVFVRTIVRAERVKKAMERMEIEALSIHRDKGQRERDLIIESFREGKVKLLIATDITARGLDIPDVDLVVNYDMPEQAENYVHRIGRTGRGRHKGKAISFCAKEEKKLILPIEQYIHKKIEILDYTQNELEHIVYFSNEKKKSVQDLIEDHEAFLKKKKSGKKSK